MNTSFIALAILSASPSTVNQQLDAAGPGDTVVLKGDFARVTVPKRKYSPRLVIDATDAKVAGVTLDNVDGVTWRGGLVTANFGPGVVALPSYGISIRYSDNVRVENARVTRANRGVVVGPSRNIVLSGLKLYGLSIDGVNVANSDRVTLEKSTIGPFKPPFLTATGPVHADGYQAWDGNTGLRIVDNLFKGNMAGIVDFGRKGDTANNIGTVIKGNRVNVRHTHGISITMTDKAIVQDNIIASGRTATRTMRTIMRIQPDTTACDNIVVDLPDGPGTGKCVASAGRTPD